MSRAVVFETRAIVLLPDHLHVIWSLPRGDAEYSRRWSWIKKEFTKQWLAICDLETDISPARKKEGRRGVWQPRFWEHTIETEIDYERHFDYIHYNPVKHGYVKCLHEWPLPAFIAGAKRGSFPGTGPAGKMVRINCRLKIFTNRLANKLPSGTA
ncbi:MAG: hypothetical protein R3C12_03490 [Planctomycetaceae bacterium]